MTNVHALATRPHVATAPRAKLAVPGSKAAIHDPRWPRVAAQLASLRGAGRHAVRIVDADCGAGSLLLHAARHARALGFTAIECRGIDGSPALIGRARAAAARCVDPAIGLSFDLTDMIAALEAEQDFPADLVLWHGSPADHQRPEALAAVRAAGQVTIADHEPAAEQVAT
ncbi:SAM-dependent methyltransferase [Sphingomonas arantia]|uniref:SAM-dependent methyltransferase n=2 Tax=Sphingomonas arantia TaxID=1460676 RepID=A0ABW4U1J8_9SPHN